MTIKELINELYKYPDNNIVLISDENSTLGYSPVIDIIMGINEFDGCVFMEGYYDE